MKEIYINALPEQVFEFLTDPVKMRRWMGIPADLDPRPGGIYRLAPGGGDVVRGEYLEVVPDSKVVFTWGFEGAAHGVPAGSTVVEIILEARGRGTWLRLSHRDLAPVTEEFPYDQTAEDRVVVVFAHRHSALHQASHSRMRSWPGTAHLIRAVDSSTSLDGLSSDC